jgi:hypothetical protein
LGKLVKHGLGVLQVESAKAFGEPAVDLGENVADLRSPALIALLSFCSKVSKISTAIHFSSDPHLANRSAPGRIEKSKFH